MDPDATLSEIRVIVARVREGRAQWNDTERLAELVQALDDWMAGGGFPPAPWISRRTT